MANVKGYIIFNVCSGRQDLPDQGLFYVEYREDSFNLSGYSEPVSPAYSCKWKKAAAIGEGNDRRKSCPESETFSAKGLLSKTYRKSPICICILVTRKILVLVVSE